MSEENLDNLQNAEGEEISINIGGQSASTNFKNAEEKPSKQQKSRDSETVFDNSENKIKKNYAEYSEQELVEEAKELVKKYNSEFAIKAQIEDIKECFYNKLNLDKKEKEDIFLAEGGDIIDFKYDNILKKQFAETYNEYRNKRNNFRKQLSNEQTKNLEYRIALIEELKSLINKEEKISETYKEFKDIQERWRNAGVVVKSESSNLWRNYHHHVENFYDYLRINNEMRDLDFKHNLEEKLKIIKRAEELDSEQNVKKALDELQLLHKIWKEETGPVAREYRDEIWQKFQTYTKKIHDKKHQLHKELHEKWEANLIIKNQIIEKICEIAKNDNDKHAFWQTKAKEVESLREEFLKIGKVPIEKSNETWQNFRDSLREFNKKKNNFYKILKLDQLENLKKKKLLLEKAELNKSSENWRETTELMKKIQNEWKKIGHVPFKEADELWVHFKNACNYYFDRLNAHSKGLDTKFSTHFEEKQKLFDNFKNIELPDDQKLAIATVKEFVSKWKSIGSVPRDKKQIETEFNNLIDSFFTKLNLGKSEALMIKFQNKMEELTESRDKRKIYQERDFIRKKMDEINREISQLENNLGFFNVSEGSPLLKDVNNKIAKNKEALVLWRKKLEHMKSIKI